MYLKQIELNHFRNISAENINFGKQINIIHGRNGQGKTSLLEAVFFLAITKSFRAKSEKIVLQHDKEYLQIAGLFETDKKDAFSVRIFYSVADGKHVFFNQNKIDKFSQLIGKIPVTLLSLEDLELAYGVPANRRKFIDILLSQVSPIYLQALQIYKKALSHRNRLLSLISENKENSSILFPWDEQLVKNGAYIIRLRQKFITFANEKIGDYYRKISFRNEQISIKYKTNVPFEAETGEIENVFKQTLFDNYDADVQRQNTLIGPHRDDLVFFKEGFPLKTYGSQGENKTLLIALKIVESEYLKEQTAENPILLMDDIFGELDNERINNLIQCVIPFGQTLITTTSREKIKGVPEESVRFMEIEQGKVVK